MCDTRTICGPVSLCVIVKRGVLERGVVKRGDSKVPRASSQKSNNKLAAGHDFPRHLQTGHGGVWRLPCSPGLLAEEELGRKGETQGANVLEGGSKGSARDTWRCSDGSHRPDGATARAQAHSTRRSSRSAKARRRTAPKCISGSTVSLVAHKLPWHRGTPTGHFPGRLVNHAIQGRILLVQKSFPAKMLTIMPWHR